MHKNHIWVAAAFVAAVTGTVIAVAVPPNLPIALEAQLELARQKPMDAKVANDLGNLLHLAGQTTQAEEAYRRASELSPEDPVPRYNLGLLLQDQGKEKEALKEFMMVAKHDPSNAWARFQIGAINESLGERSAAIRAYAAAFSLDPSLSSPSSNPQVIESRLVYEAMVRGYRDSGSRPLAPKVYDDPNRIAHLLVDPADTGTGIDHSASHEAMEAVEDENAAGMEARGAGQGTRPTGTTVRDESDPAAPLSGRQVLTPDTIERGSTLGQVNQPGRGRTARPSSRPSATIREPSTGSSTTRGFRPPGASNDARTRPGRVRFEPSVQSTGSLRLELRPVSEALPLPS